MLQKLNERIQGVVAWVVIILIAITFALFGIDYYIQTHQANNAVVDVNGEPITKEAFELSFRRARQFSEPAQTTVAGEKQLKKQVIDEMIANMVSVQAAKTNGFGVSIEQADAAILNIPQFQEDGHFSEGRYQQALSGAFFTPESFQKEVRQGMLLNQQRFAFIGTAFALPNEIQRFVKLYMQTRDYDYLTIAALPFVKAITLSDAEINKYYLDHPNEFYTPEKASIDYIRLSMKDIKNRLSPSDEQIQRYYDENESNYTTPAQWQVAHILFAFPENASNEEQVQVKAKAEQVYKDLQRDPKLFADKVKLSDDKISIRNQGVLPWVVAGQSELDRALVNITTPEEISQPVKTQHGYEIFKLIAYKPSSKKSFDEVKEDIKEQVAAELAQNEYSQALEQLSDLSYQTPDSLNPVADALKLQVQETQPFSRQGGNIPLAKNKDILNATFSHDVLELGNNSEPIQVDNDSVVVLRVNKHIPTQKKTLDEVKTTIRQKLALEKAAAQAQDLGNALLKANPEQQQKILKEHNLSWTLVTKAPRETELAPETVNELAFDLARAGATAGDKMDNGDFVVVQLKKINDGALESLDKEQLASITQQIEASYGVMDYDLFVNSQMAKAKIDQPK
jgi:peptidyl-prolyl cis-trans isomerase D